MLIRHQSHVNNFESTPIKSPSNQFALKDLGDLNIFLGMEVIPSPGGLLLSQQKYILDILKHTKMLVAKYVSTPVYFN